MTIDGMTCECAAPIAYALMFYACISLVLFFILFYQNRDKI